MADHHLSCNEARSQGSAEAPKAQTQSSRSGLLNSWAEVCWAATGFPSESFAGLQLVDFDGVPLDVDVVQKQPSKDVTVMIWQQPSGIQNPFSLSRARRPGIQDIICENDGLNESVHWTSIHVKASAQIGACSDRLGSAAWRSLPGQGSACKKMLSN